MRSTRVAFAALAVVGGYFIWRNRFAIQRQLEAFGIKTPLLTGSIGEAAQSVAAKVSGKMERGATLAEHTLNREVGNY